MQVAVGIRRAIIVDNDVHSFDIDTTAENISCNKDTLLKSLERRVAADTAQGVNSKHIRIDLRAYRSSWARPEWMLILGKLQDCSSLSSSTARGTDFTKMTTWQHQ